MFSVATLSYSYSCNAQINIARWALSQNGRLADWQEFYSLASSQFGPVCNTIINIKRILTGNFTGSTKWKQSHKAYATSSGQQGNTAFCKYQSESTQHIVFKLKARKTFCTWTNEINVQKQGVNPSGISVSLLSSHSLKAKLLQQCTLSMTTFHCRIIWVHLPTNPRLERVWLGCTGRTAEVDCCLFGASSRFRPVVGQNSTFPTGHCIGEWSFKSRQHLSVNLKKTLGKSWWASEYKTYPTYP